MPYAIPIAIAASAGAQVGGNLLIQRSQSKAAKEAAAIQNQAAMEAARRMERAGIAANAYLAPLQQRSAQAALPWEQMGQDALTSLGAMKGFRAPSPLPSPMAPGASPTGPTGMVTLKAPTQTGETRTVPWSEADRYLRQGATIVGG